MAIWHSHAGMVVGDMDKALPFYCDIFGFERVRSIEVVPDPSWPPNGTPTNGEHMKVEWIRHGDFQIELIDYVNRKQRSIDMGAMDVNATHIGFFAPDIQRHYDRIKSADIWFRSPPIFWSETSATTYGKDPDGNWFQLMLPVPNNPKAELPVDETGIGHSHAGIVVNRMEDALPFYRDLIGMEVVKVTERRPDLSDSRSSGTHLDGVSLTEIWVRKGNFIVELVDFHNKKDVRLDIADATEVHSTHLGFFVDDLQTEYKRLQDAGIWFRDKPIDPQGNPVTWAYGKDPDGNWFELIEPSPDGSGDLPQP